MVIGIHALAACNPARTGVEEYCFQLIRHMLALPESGRHRFILYVKSGQGKYAQKLFSPPPFTRVQELASPVLWTQVRLSYEMMRRPPGALFIPAHVLPVWHPARSIVSIHGLEFEYFPEYYSMFHRAYLRATTRYALLHAREVIVPSLTTKHDLLHRYGGNAEKIHVIPFGVPEVPHEIPEFTPLKPYLCYIGRIELRKNVHRLIEAFLLWKKKTHAPHELVLAGKPGYGYDTIAQSFGNGTQPIRTMGYVNEEMKWALLAHADMLVFPTLYEGFGMPILEAQAAGTPVLTSRGSACEEVAGLTGAYFVSPENIEEIAEGIETIITDPHLRASLVRGGKENLARYSWERTARETLKVIIG